MRVVVVEEFGGPDRLVVTEAAAPEPGTGEVTIDVRHAGVGFVDTLFRRGVFASLLDAPLTPGIEVSGHVRQVGPGVPMEVGQPVAALLNDFGRGSRAGGYAQVAVARADLVVALAATADLATAAGHLVNATTAGWALHRSAALEAGETVAVLGASGGVGAVAVRLARAGGASRVVAVVGRAEAADAARGAGATDVVLRRDLDGALRDLTGGRGVDVVVDPVGGRARGQAIEQLAFGGRHVIVGNASGEDQDISTDELWHRSRAVSGFSLGAAAALVPGTVTRRARDALEVLRDDGRPDNLTVADLDDVVDVHRALDDGSAPTKTVLSL